MRYEYSLHYNEIKHAWQVTWTGFDEDAPHQMKGDVVLCDSFDNAIEQIRRFAAGLEPDRSDAVA